MTEHQSDAWSPEDPLPYAGNRLIEGACEALITALNPDAGSPADLVAVTTAGNRLVDTARDLALRALYSGDPSHIGWVSYAITNTVQRLPLQVLVPTLLPELARIEARLTGLHTAIDGVPKTLADAFDRTYDTPTARADDGAGYFGKWSGHDPKTEIVNAARAALLHPESAPTVARLGAPLWWETPYARDVQPLIPAAKDLGMLVDAMPFYRALAAPARRLPPLLPAHRVRECALAISREFFGEVTGPTVRGGQHDGAPAAGDLAERFAAHLVSVHSAATAARAAPLAALARSSIREATHAGAAALRAVLLLHQDAADRMRVLTKIATGPDLQLA